MFSPLRFLALIIFLKTLGKLKFYVELHQKTANCCINIGNLSNYIVPRKHLSSFVYNGHRSKMSPLCKFSFPTHKLTDFSAFKMVYSPKTFLGPLHMSPVNRAGSVTGINFPLGSYEKFQPGFRDEKGWKILGTSSGAKFGKQSKHSETQKF